MEITCPRCGFSGEAAFEFKTDSLLSRVREHLLGSANTRTSSVLTMATDEEIGEYTVCPRCISVYAVTTTTATAAVAGSSGADVALPHPRGRQEQQQLTLLTAGRLCRFSDEAQERLCTRMESYFKLHRDSSFREDAVEYLQKYIVEHLKTQERQRMRLSELTLSFAALSENHPFHEALTRLKNRGRVHTFETEDGSGGETMVILV